MSFHDLPPNWSTLAVTGAMAPDVVDLCVAEADRAEGCLGLLLLGADGRLTQPIVIGQCPADPPDAALPGLSALRELVEHDADSVIAVRGRAGCALPRATDRAWVDFAALVFGERLREVYLATPGGVSVLSVR